MTKKQDKTSLEQAMNDIEVIIQNLSDKNLNVEQGMIEFKKGVELLKWCKKELKSAENEFQALKSELDFEN